MKKSSNKLVTYASYKYIYLFILHECMYQDKRQVNSERNKNKLADISLQ